MASYEANLAAMRKLEKKMVQLIESGSPAFNEARLADLRRTIKDYVARGSRPLVKTVEVTTYDQGGKPRSVKTTVTTKRSTGGRTTIKTTVTKKPAKKGKARGQTKADRS